MPWVHPGVEAVPVREGRMAALAADCAGSSAQTGAISGGSHIRLGGDYSGIVVHPPRGPERNSGKKMAGLVAPPSLGRKRPRKQRAVAQLRDGRWRMARPDASTCCIAAREI
jgi:hypothetical protein